MNDQIWEIVLLIFVFLVLLAAINWMIDAVRFYKTRYAQLTGARYRNTLRNAGARGEYKLGRQLEKFDPDGLMLFNVYVPKEDGGTSEVDALLVAPSGIYVFENKNYSGWIFGKKEDKTWTQTLNRKSKYRFANPIRQNAGHVAALCQYLGLPEEAFEPIVVFADKTLLKGVSAGNATILHTSQVADQLRSIAGRRQLKLPDQFMQDTYRTLCGCVNVSDEVKRAHIDRIKEKRSSSRNGSHSAFEQKRTGRIPKE